MSATAVLRVPLALTLFALGATAVYAQQGGPFAYPNAGQSEQQQSKDRYECHQWAVSQTGFDPTTAPPLAAAPPPVGAYGAQPPPQQQPSGGGFLGIGNGGMLQGSGVVGDAATGAALGAAGGAIAGDAGQGAAIGAVASTLFGALNRATDRPAAPPPQQQQQADYYRQQQQAAASQQYNQRLQMNNDYNRAFGTCMAGRNYTVN
jgi:hypothetical protein